MFRPSDLLSSSEYEALLQVTAAWTPGRVWQVATTFGDYETEAYFRLEGALPSDPVLSIVISGIGVLQSGEGDRQIVSPGRITALGFDNYNQADVILPEALGRLTALRDLSLPQTLTGTIPASLGNLTQLRDLSLRGSLEGPIPDSFGNLTALRSLSLAGNLLTGPIPEGVFGLPNLTALSLQNNYLSGSLPGLDLFSGSLQVLNLEWNDLRTDVAASDWQATAELLRARGVNVSDGFQKEMLAEVSNILGLRDATLLRDGVVLTLEAGMRLFLQDKITTGARTVVELAGPDGTRITLGGNTAFEINPDSSSVLGVRTNLIEGVMHFFRAPGSSASSWSFETPSGGFAVRGTEFSLSHLPGAEGGLSTLSVLSGNVDVFAANGDVLRASAGGSVTLSDGAPLPVANTPVQIEGQPEPGSLLTADLAPLLLQEGLTQDRLSLQWMRDGAVIPGAVGASYRLTQDDVGTRISLLVQWQEDLGMPRIMAAAAETEVTSAAALRFLGSAPIGVDLSGGLHGAVVTDLDQDGRAEVTPIRFSFPGGVDLPVPVLEFQSLTQLTDLSGTILTSGRPTTDFGRQIVVTDLNKDGWEDILIADHGFDQTPFPGAINRVYLSDGQGRLVDRSADFSRGADFTHSLAVGDLNGDGQLEVFFGNLGVDQPYFASLLPNGTVAFDLFNLPFGNANMFSTALMADLNGNGRDALILGVDQNIQNGARSVVIDWTSAGPVSRALPNPTYFPNALNTDVAVMDLNRDGLQDIVFLQTAAAPFYQGMFLQFLVQQSDGSFQDRTTDYVETSIFNDPNAGGAWGFRLHVKDLNGDGREDILVEMKWPDQHRVLLQGEDGRFSASTVSIGGIGANIAFGDVTGDGMQEMLLISNQQIEIWSTGARDMPVVEPAGRRIVGTAAAETLSGGRGDDVLYGDGYRAVYDLDEARAVYRLYQATLNRAPDTGGQAGWTEQLAGGANTLTGVAAGFVDSREFQNVYGALSNTAFVELLYQNVLGRAADAGGLAGWTNALAGGTSRAQVVTGFSESTEFRNSTNQAATEFTQGRDASFWQDDVYRLYQATLARAPDAGGFQGWLTNLSTGTPFLTAVAGFVNSPEFQNTYGALSNTAFVELLYQNVLGRAADSGGLAGWLAALDGGQSRAQVVLGFSQSPEFVAATAPGVKAWIRAQGPDDYLEGGAGSNDLWGGAGADVFRFDREDAGSHRVHDFEAWDYLEFRAFGYADAAAVRANMTQQGADVVFSDQGTTVTLANTQLASIDNDTFVF